MESGLLSARRLYVNLDDSANVLSVICKLFCGWHLRDRFGILNKHSEINWSKVADPIPFVPTEPLLISDLMDEQANKILDAHKDGDIVVSWSGGVDSTAVICALLKNGLETNRLKVICAESSPNEYPWFYKYLINSGIQVNVTDRLINALSEVDCGLIVNGWCADQLFGSNIHLRNLELYNKPWMDGLRQAMKDSYINLTDHSYEILEAVYSDYAQKLGFKVEQWCEFAWLFNFGVKWTYVKDEQRMALAGTKNQDKTFAFFDSIGFQQFAMQRFDGIKIRNVNKQNRFYKRPLKQYIYEFTNDEDYFNHKGKRNSWAMVGEDLNQVAVVTDNSYLNKSFTFTRLDSMKTFTGTVSNTIGKRYAAQVRTMFFSSSDVGKNIPIKIEINN